jgi:small subunit ribosomal protein S4
MTWSTWLRPETLFVRDKSKKQTRIEALQLAQQVGMPVWVDVSLEKAEGNIQCQDRDRLLRMLTSRHR